MNWYEKCLLDLSHHKLFENTEHRQRFRDLLTCYYTAPFFTKGLCKCMYLSSWDEEHFIVMLEVLNQMTLEGDKNLNFMKGQGEVLEQQMEGYDAEIFKLSNAFLNNKYYECPDFGDLDPEGVYIIRQALKAADLIDELPKLEGEA